MTVSARFTVIIEAPTVEQAEQVMAERTGFDEDYGFDYTLTVQFEEAKEKEETA